jgi:hypothetical protein
MYSVRTMFHVNHRSAPPASRDRILEAAADERVVHGGDAEERAGSEKLRNSQP